MQNYKKMNKEPLINEAKKMGIPIDPKEKKEDILKKVEDKLTNEDPEIIDVENQAASSIKAQVSNDNEIVEIEQPTELTNVEEDGDLKENNPPVNLRKQSIQSNVLTIKGEDRFESEIDKERNTLQNLEITKQMYALNPKHAKPHTGIIESYGPEMYQGKKTYVVKLRYEGLIIIIPADELIQDKDLTQIDDRQLNMIIQRRNGSEIDFIPTEIIKDTNYVLASRLRAMEVVRLGSWLADENKPKFIDKGRIVQARVVTLAKGGIIVEVFGAETFIIMRELSHGTLSDPREKFSVGDKVFVMITECIKDIKNGTVSFSASVKKAEKDPKPEAYEFYQVNQQARGVVTYINVNPKPQAFVRLNGIDCQCNFEFAKTPMIGDEVDIVIYRKHIFENDDGTVYKLWGNITHINRKPNISNF